MPSRCLAALSGNLKIVRVTQRRWREGHPSQVTDFSFEISQVHVRHMHAHAVQALARLLLDRASQATMLGCTVVGWKLISSPRHQVDAELTEGLQEYAGGLVKGIDLLVHEGLS